MITNFALSLTFNGIRLLQRANDGWLLVGDVALDSPDLTAALAKLRDRALALSPDGLRCKIVIPDEQIRYLTMSGVAPGQERSAARVALEGATPYRVEQLNFDCVRLSDGNVSVAAGNYGRRHLARRFKVVEANGDIQTRRFAVHQFNHRDTGHFNHFQRARGMRTFSKDKTVDIP